MANVSESLCHSILVRMTKENKVGLETLGLLIMAMHISDEVSWKAMSTSFLNYGQKEGVDTSFISDVRYYLEGKTSSQDPASAIQEAIREANGPEALRTLHELVTITNFGDDQTEIEDALSKRMSSFPSLSETAV